MLMRRKKSSLLLDSSHHLAMPTDTFHVPQRWDTLESRHTASLCALRSSPPRPCGHFDGMVLWRGGRFASFRLSLDTRRWAFVFVRSVRGEDASLFAVDFRNLNVAPSYIKPHTNDYRNSSRRNG